MKDLAPHEISYIPDQEGSAMNTLYAGVDETRIYPKFASSGLEVPRLGQPFHSLSKAVFARSV